MISIRTQLQPKIDKVLIGLEKELKKLGIARVSPALVEDLTVDYQGYPTPLKSLASIRVQQGNLLVIEPWDKECLPAIHKAILTSELHFSPRIEDGQILIPVPSMTTEDRERFVQKVNQEKEKSRITLRNIRDEAWKEIRQKEAQGEISEDEKYKSKDELEEVIREGNGKIEDIVSKKIKQLTTL